MITIIVGAYFGSFCSKLVYRLAGNRFKGLSVLSPSFCPSCGRSLRLVDKIPVYSYFHLKGKCRRCGQPISYRYLLFEIVGLVLPFFLYWYLNYSLFEVIISYLFLMTLLINFFICLDTSYPSNILSGFILLLALIQNFYLGISFSQILTSVAIGAFLILIFSELFYKNAHRSSYIIYGASLGSFFIDGTIAVQFLVFLVLIIFNKIYNAFERKTEIYFGALFNTAAIITWVFETQLLSGTVNLIRFIFS